MPLGMFLPENKCIKAGNKIDKACSNAGNGVNVLNPIISAEKAEENRKQQDNDISLYRLSVLIQLTNTLW